MPLLYSVYWAARYSKSNGSQRHPTETQLVRVTKYLLNNIAKHEQVITVTKYIKMLKAALTHVPTITDFISRYHTYNNNKIDAQTQGSEIYPS